MKKTKTLRVLAMILLGLATLPGCIFTAAQFSDWTASDKGLVGLTFGALWDRHIVTAINPTNDKVAQSYLDLGRRVGISLTGNYVNQEIPLDPGSIK